MSDTNKNTLTLYNLVGYAYMKRLNDKWFFSIDNINWVSEDDPDFPKVTIMSTPKADPSNDVSPTIQEPQRVPENTDSDTQVVDEELREQIRLAVTYLNTVPDSPTYITIEEAEPVVNSIEQLIGQQLVKELERLDNEHQTNSQDLERENPGYTQICIPCKPVWERIDQLKAQYNLNPKERSE